VVARQGQLFGDPARGATARVTNGKKFSYPGYHEMLVGFGDPRIDSNDKRINPNVTVLEWLNRRPAYSGRVAAFCSWDVFPFILAAERSGVAVNAGWQPVPAGSAPRADWLNEIAAELPHQFEGSRFAVFTFHAAMDTLRHRTPRVLYVAFDETDNWAHEGRYDLYLGAAARCDRYIRRLWETAQQLPEYRGCTALVISTDHGRGDGPAWRDHGEKVLGAEYVWIALLGPDTPALGVRDKVSATQGQIAATVAALLGEDFCAASLQSAPVLPQAIGAR
jgi:hypothetical protein